LPRIASGFFTLCYFCTFFFVSKEHFFFFFLLIDIKSLSAALAGAYIMLWPGSVRLSRLRNLQKREWKGMEKWQGKAGGKNGVEIFCQQLEMSEKCE